MFYHCSSEEWSLISDEEREEMGLMFDHDGEFWQVFIDNILTIQCAFLMCVGPCTIERQCPSIDIKKI